MSAFRLLETIGLFAIRRPGTRKRRARTPRAGSRSVGRYLLHNAIGKGAVGEVWRAEDPRIGRSVAVKLLNIPSGVAGKQRTEWEQRFVREARAAGALSHPGIVTIHDVGVTEDGNPFIVMELVEGSSLDKILAEGSVDERSARIWGAQISEALAAAHRQGIVHRDIKPANVLIDSEGRARIADFGIARLAESDLTHAGLFLGSPAFSSPEQIKGAAVDGRSDIFSLGAVLYAVLTGDRPFHGEDLSSLAYAIAHVEPAPMRRLVPGLSPEMEAVVMKSLEKDPARRYGTALEMAEDLRAILSERPLRHAVVASPLDATVRSDDSDGGGIQPAAPVAATTHSGWSTWLALGVAIAMTLGVAVTISVLLLRPGVGLASMRTETSPASSAPVTSDGGAAGQMAWTVAASTAQVDVRVSHALSDGVVTIWSGKRRLVRAHLGPEPTVAWSLRLPPGVHPIRVRVASAERGLDLQEEFIRSLADGDRARLYVRVKDRPSPKLDIMWTDN